MANLTSTLRKPVDAVDDLGGQLRFYLRSIGWAPRTIRRYKKEVLRLLAEVSLGTGALSVIGGTVGVITFMLLFVVNFVMTAVYFQVVPQKLG